MSPCTAEPRSRESGLPDSGAQPARLCFVGPAAATMAADTAAWKADTHRSRRRRSLPEQAQG